MSTEAITTREERTALAAPVEMGAQMMSLYQQALDKGEAGVNALEKLIDLQMKMQRIGAERSFTLALSDFQQQCPPIQKKSSAKIVTKSGGGYGFTYADFEEIVSTVRPHLTRNGFSFTFDTEATASMLKCTCTLHHSDGHKTSASFACPTENSSGASAQQKFGGANTYARRQSLINVLGLSLTDPIADEKDLETITAEQCANIEALIEETGASSSLLLKVFGVEKISDISRARYDVAVNMLAAKRKGAKS